MLKRIERIITNSRLYNLIRFNQLSDLLVEAKTRRTHKAINFFSSFLDKEEGNKLAFDIGANKGNKVKALLKMGYKVIAVEPEKKALSTLRWRFGKNKNVSIIPKGVSDNESTLVIHIAESRSGLNTLSDKWVNTLESESQNRWHKKQSFKNSYEVEVTTLDKLFETYGFPYFIKIDVEGYEHQVIKGMSKAPALMSFEANLPEFLEETIAAINHLNKLSVNPTFNYSISDKIESPGWMSADAIIKLVGNPEIRYMEIISRKGTDL